MRKEKNGARGGRTLRDWVLAVRPWSFPASAMPVVVTVTYLHWRGHEVDWVCGVWALLNIILFHAAGNAWSDYFDYRAGVDREDTFGSKVICGGTFSPREVKGLGLGLMLVAVVAGIALWLHTNNTVLYVGMGGCLAALLYPQLKYRAMGDVVIFVTYALLPTVGTSAAVVGSVDWGVLWLAVPVGLITVAILHANNTRDIRTDARANIRTLAMAVGGRKSVWLYCAEVTLPFVWLAACVAAGVFPLWTLVMVVALVPALRSSRVALSYETGGEEAIALLDVRTATLQIQFSLLLALSFVVASLV